MKDIVQSENGSDLVVRDDIAPKAANVISTQIGRLEYAQDFGADLKYFLDVNFEFQNESFQAYLIERLIFHSVNVVSVLSLIQSFTENFEFEVGSVKNEGFIL